MNAKCPHCGANYEVTESELGTQADCIECGRTFVVGDDASHLPSNAPSTHVSLDSGRNKNRNHVNMTWRPKNENDVSVKCPHCGTAYNTQQGDLGKSHVCEGCNTEFKMPSAYICPECGIIKWFDQPYTEMRALEETFGGWIRYGGWIDFAIKCIGGGLILWAILTLLDDSFDGKANPNRMSFWDFWIYIFFRTWQGMAGGILLIVSKLFSCKKLSEEIKAISECSKCKRRLLDLNSPMGWKLYKELYCNN